MAIVKPSSSGKSFLFIDDDGNVFVTSRSYLKGLVDGSVSSKFLLLKRLPNKVEGHFLPSPLVGDDFAKVRSGDSFSQKRVLESREVKLGGVDFDL